MMKKRSEKNVQIFAPTGDLLRDVCKFKKKKKKITKKQTKNKQTKQTKTTTTKNQRDNELGIRRNNKA